MVGRHAEPSTGVSSRVSAARAVVRRRFGSAPPAAQSRTAASQLRVRRVWAMNALLGWTALGLYIGVVNHVQMAAPVAGIPWILFALLFCVAEGWRVYVHFRRNAHSFSLSELPLVLGLYFASPQTLLSARLAGAVVALWVIRRHPPIKVVFNLALYAIEVEVAVWLLSILDPMRLVATPASWAIMLGVIGVVAVLGFSLTAVVITLSEGRLSRPQLVRGYAFSIGAGLVNACLAIQAAAAISTDPAELWLLGLPLLGVAGAYLLYTTEYQKRQRIQHLYECSDLLQRAAVAETAVPELLAQISQVFRAEMAEVVLLPIATGTGRASTTSLRNGEVRKRDQEVDRFFLEGLLMAVGSETRARGISWEDASDGVRKWLERQDLKDAMLTSLWGDGALLGVLTVGNRMSDVGTFGTEDLTLFETFGAQTSVAVQNMRLDHTLTYQAFHDPLTHLANRVLFTDRLEHALSRRDEKRGLLAVLFVDLDDFKMVNDTFGHAPGDELLRSVAERLRSVLRPADTAARFGGDEFAILLEDSLNRDDVVSVAERIVAALKPHFVVERQEVAVHASIGVAIASATAVEAEELLRRADAAMYWAKVQGKGGYEVYDAGMLEGSGRRLQVRTELERAIADGDLRVHYQPIVQMRTGALQGVEALVRWEHPERGWILPSEFIGVAEETGLIADVGDFVLREACAQVRQWETITTLHREFQLHVNVSPRQLRSAHLMDEVREVLAETKLDPTRLVIEMTESFVGEHGDVARERMRELKTLGVDLAIDDFGTGYSSLAILHDMPFDILKVDRAFIDEVDDDARRRAFTAAIFGLGKTLGLRMVAEGVEREQQRLALMSLGCTLAQGFLFSPAVDHVEITAMLRRPAPSADIVPLRVVTREDGGSQQESLRR
jgi:diguanylate cyclase (GGDEF)-like protein